MSNIFCEYVDLDERKEVTLIHNGKRHQDIGQLFIMNFEGTKSSIFVVRFYVWVCFFCLQVYGV
jgi:aminopeptidase C